jgi:hypothetical protein
MRLRLPKLKRLHGSATQLKKYTHYESVAKTTFDDVAAAIQAHIPSLG